MLIAKIHIKFKKNYIGIPESCRINPFYPSRLNIHMWIILKTHYDFYDKMLIFKHI